MKNQNEDIQLKNNPSCDYSSLKNLLVSKVFWVRLCLCSVFAVPGLNNDNGWWWNTWYGV